ncbi:helix-turn-helix domain-containing protein [Streptomyces sp. CdTB01]|uniref:helix-turn-helix domain-containing protein n=1 Tax=Streptomyces sp. CdTB01 TaxID=1725411 RepID=UPI000A5B528E|nr:helix-turn-helix domain-containing protein [Streptomyces sp. CdTB01]
MTINVLPQHPMPSHPRRRDGKAPLPAPEERARLRRAWQLSDEQVAAAFGVTAATVRSWESGRTTPTGLRRAAYAAFLSGLAQGLAPAVTDGSATSTAVHPPRRTAQQRVRRPESRPQSRPTPQPPAPEASASPEAVPGRAPVPVALPVGPGPDPITPARRRRLRVAAAAAGAWIVFLHLVITSPPPHM